MGCLRIKQDDGIPVLKNWKVFVRGVEKKNRSQIKCLNTTSSEWKCRGVNTRVRPIVTTTWGRLPRKTEKPACTALSYGNGTLAQPVGTAPTLTVNILAPKGAWIIFLFQCVPKCPQLFHFNDFILKFIIVYSILV